MRIGIAVKPGLAAARDTLVELEAWLRDRGVDAVWSTEAAKLLDPARAHTAERTEMPVAGRSVLVLGGDGTLLAVAKAIAESGRDMPILGRQLRLARLPDGDHAARAAPALDAVIAGRASYDCA